MATKKLFRLKNLDASEAFSVEDQGDGTTVVYIDGVATTVAIPGVTSTATELNQLHSAGALQADFIKLHAVGSTAAEIDYQCDVSANVQTLTASGAVLATAKSVQLAHDSVVIASTIASLVAHPGIFVVKNTSASGTAAHTCTVTTGTFDGTHQILTLPAPGDAGVFYIDSAGAGVVVKLVGTAALT